MRRASIVLAVLGLAVLAMTGVASATPKVSLKATAVPIPGFPGTGNIYGHGAAVKVEYVIEGTEYGGFPPPLKQITFFLPKGTKLHTSGFPTCPISNLEPSGAGPSACPHGSAVGPVGSALGEVAFGKEIVPEATTVQGFYSSTGGINFITLGHEPVSLEILSKGHYTHLSGGGGFGPEFVAEIPLVETVPGAQDASVKKINVTAGSAIKKHGKTIYYGTLPKKGECPKGGFHIKSEITFYGVGGLSEQHVTAEYKAPCPRH
jgi:hypothetical protein